MKKIIFTVTIIILLAAIGAIAYVWLDEGHFISVKEGLPSSSPQAYVSVTEAEPVAYQKPGDSVIIKFPVFNYHHIRPMPPETAPIDERSFAVSPEGFEAHLKYFQDNGYRVVLARELINYFDEGKPLPAKAVAITFDDGRYGQYEFAFSLLKKYGMRATFFITTEWIGKKDFMTWAEIKEMSDAGMEIGSHGFNHANLTALSDDDLMKQLVESKSILEEKTGRTVDLLAYPGGNYNERVIEMAKATSYGAAFGVYKIINQMPKYRYQIRRFHADDWLDSVAGNLVGY